MTSEFIRAKEYAFVASFPRTIFARRGSCGSPDKSSFPQGGNQGARHGKAEEGPPGAGGG